MEPIAALPKPVSEWEMCNYLTQLGGVFDARQYLCVPNVSHGWDLGYEADLIAVTAAGYAYEVEIKLSFQDLIADAAKAKWRQGLDSRIKRFYFAVPAWLVRDALDKPDYFGVISVEWNARHDRFYSKIVRKAHDLPGHRRLTPQNVQTLHRLGTLRYWDMRLREREPKCFNHTQTSDTETAPTASTEKTSCLPASSNSLESPEAGTSTSEPTIP